MNISDYAELSDNYGLLVVFLYNLIQDPTFDKEDRIKASKLVIKIIPKVYLLKSKLKNKLQDESKKESIKEFMQIIETFLGKLDKFKQYLQQSLAQIQDPEFNLLNILSELLTQANKFIEDGSLATNFNNINNAKILKSNFTPVI